MLARLWRTLSSSTHRSGEFGTGTADGGELVCAHTLPVCAKYRDLNADEYLMAVLAAGRPS